MWVGERERDFVSEGPARDIERGWIGRKVSCGDGWERELMREDEWTSGK